MGGRGSSGSGSGRGRITGIDYSGPESWSDLPTLQGSEKQIKWANDIRKKILSDVISTAQTTMYGNPFYPKYINKLYIPEFTALKELFSKDAVSRAVNDLKKEASGMSPKDAKKFLKEQNFELRAAISYFESTIELFKNQTSAKWWIENRYKRYSNGDIGNGFKGK